MDSAKDRFDLLEACTHLDDDGPEVAPGRFEVRCPLDGTTAVITVACPTGDVRVLGCTVADGDEPPGCLAACAGRNGLT